MQKNSTRDIFFCRWKNFVCRFASFFFLVGEKIITFCALCSVSPLSRERERKRENTLSRRRLSKVFVIAYRCNTTTLCCRSPLESSSSSKSNYRFRYERLVQSFRPLFSVRRTLNGHKSTTRWIIIIIARRRGAKRSVKSTETWEEEEILIQKMRWRKGTSERIIAFRRQSA